MKNLRHIVNSVLTIAFIMLIVFTFSSCGNSSSSSISSLSDEQKEVAENSLINGLVMVPLYHHSLIPGNSIVDNEDSTNAKDHDFSLISGHRIFSASDPEIFGFKKTNGEWVQFDDEADYSSILNISYITKKIWDRGYLAGWKRERFENSFAQLGIDIEDVFTFDVYSCTSKVRIPKEIWNNPELQVEMNKGFDNIFYQLQQAVSMYYSGNKDRIADRELFSVVNKFHYDEHPEEWLWGIEEERYGKKSYMEVGTGNKVYLCRRDKRRALCTAEGDSIPDDILLMDDILSTY